MSTQSTVENKVVTIVLAGNANVGKSAIFNQLTGLTQETGNWTGKTVGVREGMLSHHGRQFKIVDLPGIYSFSTYSPEEMITRDYILTQRPDVVIDVVDATSLERNLYFTIQLKEMNAPFVIALNYADIARKKHINLNTETLSQAFSVPVIKTVAIQGLGVHELIDASIEFLKSRSLPDQRQNASSDTLTYGSEVESRISKLAEAVSRTAQPYNRRWLAIKLLENDPGIVTEMAPQYPGLLTLARELSGELTRIHGEDSAAIMAAERYVLAAKISRQVNSRIEPVKRSAAWLETLSLHPVVGYLMFIALMIGILTFISFFGGWLTDEITNFFNALNPHGTGPLADIFWNGGVVGFYAALSVALGFILPFYLILSWLGESGYLPRIAFIMDRPCHTLGLHGQASLPLITALGCNVPACLACRIMDDRRDRLIATFLSTLIPCSARTSVVLGLVGAFVGWQWAVGLFAFQLLLIFIIGQILKKITPSVSPGIIMEIPEYRWPSWKIVWKQSWVRFKDFLVLGIPLIVAGSLVIETLHVYGWLDRFTDALTPLTVTWLGLPPFVGVLLIFGILRKEANLALLIAFAGGAEVASIITPLQMVVFSLIIMLYIPCISTIAVLFKEIGLKLTIAVIVFEIGLALVLGGLAYRLLGLFLS